MLISYGENPVYQPLSRASLALVPAASQRSRPSCHRKSQLRQVQTSGTVRPSLHVLRATPPATAPQTSPKIPGYPPGRSPNPRHSRETVRPAPPAKSAAHPASTPSALARSRSAFPSRRRVLPHAPISTSARARSPRSRATGISHPRLSGTSSHEISSVGSESSSPSPASAQNNPPCCSRRRAASPPDPAVVLPRRPSSPLSPPKPPSLRQKRHAAS